MRRRRTRQAADESTTSAQTKPALLLGVIDLDETLSIRQCSRLTHKSMDTISRAVRSGRLAAKRVPVPGSRAAAPYMISVRSLLKAGFEVFEEDEGGAAQSEPGARPEIERLRIALARSEGRLAEAVAARSTLEVAMRLLERFTAQLERGDRAPLD